MTNSNGEFKPSFSAPGGGIALEEFWGTLGKPKWETRTGTKDGKDWSLTECQFPNAGIEIIKTREPYPWPIATIKVLYQDPNQSYSKVADTEWSVLAESIRLAFGRQPEIDELEGKKFHWVFTDAPHGLNQRGEDGKYVTKPGKCWQVVEIQGIKKPSAGEIYDMLAELGDGKTEDKFYEDAFQKAEVRSNMELVNTITERQILGTMATMGVLKMGPDLLLHRVGTVAEPNSIAVAQGLPATNV